MKNLKQIMAASLGICLIASSSAYAYDLKENVKLSFTIDENIFTINGFPKESAAPYIIGETTLVPLRAISEGFGADISWDAETKTVTVKNDKKTILLQIMNKEAKINNKTVILPVAPEIKDNSVMVPIRFVAENFYADVKWDSILKKIDIISKNIELSSVLTQIDNTKWNYNEDDGVYWQIGINYCANPADIQYETLGIFVPAAYMKANENDDGTFTCEIDNTAEIGNYTAYNAPIVIPVNTPGYSAMKAPTDYVNDVKDYTDSGFIYINAGCRGRENGAPAGITDLKAAVKYIRYNEKNIPGSMDRIFTFGMSGGGAQSALMGAAGDSDLYNPYLKAIGAIEGYSDSVAGSMCWCPITNLDYANEAYEWNLGISRENLDEDMQNLSDNMALEFAKYINELGLKDETGNTLELTESEEGIYQSGSYYDYIKNVIENSLDNFLIDTVFPYTPNSGFRGNNGGEERMDLPNNHHKFENVTLDDNNFEAMDGINRNENKKSNETYENKTYETINDYIEDLNKDIKWIEYDESSNTAKITSVEDFVRVCKNASKNVGAFDDLDANQGENVLFGYDDGKGAHFDSIMAELLKNNEKYGNAYAVDLVKADSIGNTVDYRMNMYNPMYYICDYYDGYKNANVAKYWRIRTGINQGDTALSTEINLALALKNYGIDVDFETVWGMGHTMAERSGNSNENFIKWVNECSKD